MNNVKVLPRKVRSGFRLIRKKVERAQERRLQAHDPRPRVLSVEPTSRCNLNCPFCLVGLQNTLPSTEHDLLPRGFGSMEMDLFEKICRDAKEFGIRRVQLHFQGEPLLHKQFPVMVRTVKAHDMKTNVFTNGLPLTEKMADRILESGLDAMRFSVDGATQETYALNRVGGQFERVYANMAMMVRKAQEARSPIKLEWQFIALRNNEHEIPLARELAERIGIKFFVKTFAESVPDLIPRDPSLRRQRHAKPCTDIYRAIFVYYNGDVVPCCYDQTGAEVCGNLGQQSLTDIWYGDYYVNLRRRIDNAVNDPDNEPEICKSCLKWAHPHEIVPVEGVAVGVLETDLV